LLSTLDHVFQQDIRCMFDGKPLSLLKFGVNIRNLVYATYVDAYHVIRSYFWNLFCNTPSKYFQMFWCKTKVTLVSSVVSLVKSKLHYVFKLRKGFQVFLNRTLFNMISMMVVSVLSCRGSWNYLLGLRFLLPISD